MANLTLTVDAAVLKRARIRALERGESVNQILARTLAEYADADGARDRKRAAAADFVTLSRELATEPSAPLSREELWSERLDRERA